MGIGKKLKKAVKKVTRSVETVVKAPVKVVGELAQGDFSGAVKEVGRGVGGAANVATGGLYGSGDAQKLLNNDIVNTLTFNTGKELAYVGQGFNDLQKKGEADDRFYQSGLSLGAKAGAGFAIAGTSAGLSGTLTAKNFGTAQVVKSLAGSGDIAGAGAALAGAAGYENVGGFLNQVSNNVNSRAPAQYAGAQEYAEDNFYPSSQTADDGSSISQLLIWSAVAVGAVFLIKRGF